MNSLQDKKEHDLTYTTVLSGLQIPPHVPCEDEDEDEDQNEDENKNDNQQYADDSNFDPNLYQTAFLPSDTQKARRSCSLPKSFRSSRTLSSIPMPSPLCKRQDRDEFLRSIMLSAHHPTRKTKFTLNITYHVVFSRTLAFRYVTCKLDGFLEKSLSGLIAELPFESKDDIEGLGLRLYGPGVDAELGDSDYEEYWEEVKKDIRKLVSVCIKRSPSEKVAICIELEAMRETRKRDTS